MARSDSGCFQPVGTASDGGRSCVTDNRHGPSPPPPLGSQRGGGTSGKRRRCCSLLLDMTSAESVLSAINLPCSFPGKHEHWTHTEHEGELLMCERYQIYCKHSSFVWSSGFFSLFFTFFPISIKSLFPSTHSSVFLFWTPVFQICSTLTLKFLFLKFPVTKWAKRLRKCKHWKWMWNKCAGIL